MMESSVIEPTERDPLADEEGAAPPTLLCVEYPGCVVNTAAMVETLGGLKTIAKVYEESNRRLELRFRPKDVFCKPACGERSKETGFLLRVKRLRRKNGDKYEYKLVPEILGTIDATFKFTSLCDFQYLPMQKDEASAGGYKSIYESVYFDRLVDTSWLENGDAAPLFLPPAVFSRMETPQDYQYRREAANEKSAYETPFNIIGRTRQRRSHHAIFVTYDVERVPDKARDVAVSQLKVKFISQQQQKVVQEKFEECPVWSKNALHAVTGISPEKLKVLLPSVAFYFTTGPWRNQWIRLGYDPRQTREAAQYQTMDYRVRVQGGAKHKVKAKRSYANYILPYKATNTSKSKTSVIDRGTFSSIAEPSGVVPADPRLESVAAEEEAELLKDIYLFRPHRIPPYRQMFYQFKDLELDRAKQLVSEAMMEGISACDEKQGWFKPGTDQELRELMTKCINEHLASEREDGFSATNTDSVIGVGEDEDRISESETSSESEVE